MELSSRSLKFLAAFVVMAAWGCVPEPLPVDELPKLEQKIVVASQIIPGQGLVVFLTRSLGALDAGDGTDAQALLNQIVINDALVTLQYTGGLDTLASLGNGLYGGLTINWQSSEVYELRVNSPEFGRVNAFARPLARVPFQTAEARLFVTEFDSLAEVSYSLQDPPGANYYAVAFQEFSANQQLGSLLNPDVFLHLNDDRAFDGQRFDDQFRVFFRDFSAGDSVAVFLTNVQKEYYDYLKLRKDNRYTFAELASEPLNYPTNVNGGLGFFNLHLPDVRIFVLDE